MKLKTAIIIDDEPFARDDLRYLLLSHPEIEIVGEAGSVKEAEQLLKRIDPDVVFLDIQLRGGSGFDLISSISPVSSIIFFTAYDDYKEKASLSNAVDYLLKPVRADRLGVSMQKLQNRA